MMRTSNPADKIAAQDIRGGAPSFDAPSPSAAITPNRAVKFGELKPRIPKPRAISAKPPHVISSVGPQSHYKSRGTF